LGQLGVCPILEGGRGAYGYPIEQASRIALATVGDFLKKGDRLEKVIFVLFSREDLKIFIEAAEKAFL